jgi:hypothetical protein
VTATRNILLPRAHPLSKVEEHEEALDAFKESLRQFKPKQSVLEIGLALDQDRLAKFQSTLSLQNERHREKLERIEYQKEVRRKFEAEQRQLEERIIRMKNEELKHDQVLQAAAGGGGSKMSKKRR